MNKIYKVMYSKVKQCCVVVSEIAKSHGHNGESSGVRKHAALTAAVLLALGSLSFTTAFVPMTAEAADKTRTDGSNFVGVERTNGLIDESKYENSGGKGAQGADSITLGLHAQAGAGTITIGDRRSSASMGSVYVGHGDIANPELDTGGWVTSIGYNSDATGYGSIALGSNAVAKNFYAKDSKGNSLKLNDDTKFRLNPKPDIQRASVAIGYGASADNGNIAIGSYSDASTDLRTAKTKDGKEIKSYLTDKMADSYVSVGDGKDHSETQYRRISNVADGASASDVATVGQLQALSAKVGVYDAGFGIVIDSDKDNKKNTISLNRKLGTNLDKTGHVYLDVSDTGLVLGTVVDGASGTDMDLHYGATGDYAVTVGGGANTASGKASVVLGGSLNKASNEATVASGGSSNVASGSMAAVYGGFDNEASEAYATILGGAQNKASNTWTAVGGGALNEASGKYASVWGGYHNKATDDSAAVYGGLGNSAYGSYSAILGGGSNKAGGGAAVVSGGASNEAAGVESAVLGGVGNIVTGANATAVGGVKGSVNGVGSVGILGGSTGTNAPFTLAAGYQSTVTDTGVTSTPITEEEAEKFQEEGTHPGLLVGSNDPDNLSFKILDHFATAVGYQATADEAQTVAFGHDKGDTYYGTTTYTWKQKATIKDGHYYDEYGSEINEDDYKSLMNADGTWNDYSQPIATVEEKKYDSAYYNRLVKAADGIEDHDAVVMEQLKKASDVGSHIKVYKTDTNGNVQFDENNKPIEDTSDAAKTKAAQKASEDAWGEAIGTGEVADPDASDTETNGSQQLVTGGTVYKALNGGMTKIVIGTPGENGKDGAPGTIGLVGPAGADGKNAEVDITIQQGKDNDAKGIKGANGVDGKDGITRIVYKDAAGDHQVATMEDGLKFAGDDGQNDATKAIAKKLNNTIDIIGGADRKKLTENNIGVNNVDGKLKVQLAQNLTGITSISNQTTNGTTTTGAKIELGTNGTTISGGDVNVSTHKITGLQDGTATTDAATVGQMKTAIGDAKTKYYSVQEGLRIGGFSTNENNDGASASTLAGLAAGYETGTTGIASTVVGSYSGVIGSSWLQGAAAVSVGTVNVNNNTGTSKAFSGVANSIVGQANMTTDSNAAIIVGAGNRVTNSYRDLDPEDALSKITSAVISKDANALKEALQDAVPKSGGQVMVMGGGNNVESAYMSQVVGVGNTVKGNQVKNTEGEWATDTSDTAIKDYDSEKSSQYNYVDGFNNEVINGKHDYIIGANNKLDGDSYDDNNAKPIKRSNKSNVVIGDNHALTGKKNNVIIGSADTEGTLTRASDAVIIGHNANATSDTGADNAVAIGLSATAGGGNAVTIGVNTSAGDNSITIGSESSAISGSNIAIGRYARVYGDKVTNAVALGHNANAKVADGVAIGSGSEATVTGKSTEGYDPTTGKNSTETTSTWQATNAAVSIGTVDGKVTRQINGVAAGTNDTDAVNVAQLKKLEGMKANVDASNIGKNLKGADGKTAAAYAEKTANEKAWGAALGTGDIATPKDMLVTDKAIHDELRPATDGTYVKGSQTTAENLSKLDAQVKTNADDISTNTTNITKNAGDITNLKNLSNITNEGQKVIKNLSKDAVKVTAGDRVTVTSTEDKEAGTITYKVSANNDGKVAAGDQNLVSGDTVNTAITNAITNAGTATDTKLAGKANVDASNIGANLKGADGKAASAEAQKANAEKWGSAIGTGEIKADDGRMVTGKTVYDEVRPKVDGSYVKKDKTTGENLSALDSKIGSMDKDGNYIKKDDSISENLSTLDTQVKKNADDITNINQSISTLDQNAVKYDDSNKSKVTLAGKEGTTITNVNDGALSEKSSDAVNGKQLYNEQKAREEADKAITEKVTNNTNEITKIKNGDFTDASKTAIHNIAKDAVKVVNGTNTTVTTVDGTNTTPTTYAVNVEGNGKVDSGDKGLISGGTLYNEVRPTEDGNYVKKDKTTGQNLSALDSGLKATSDLIHTNTQQIYRDMNNAYGRLNNNINKAAAGSNALAALHPLDYDPDDKADFAVGYGHYRNANAAAVGAFYHPNENTMVNVGVSLGNGDPGFNAGVSFKVGRGGAGHEAMSKTEMAKVINSQSKEIDALKKDNADKDKRIDALEQKMAEILAKLDKNGK